jgi:hypothetical protein
LQKQSFAAFAKQQNADFLFDGKAIYLQQPQQTTPPGEPELITTFSYLFFAPQQISINQNGYIQPDLLTFTLNQREQQLNLAYLLADKNER